MPQVKFGRNYILSIQLRDGSILNVALPLTVEFDITRNIATSANVCSIRIYNLSPKNRNQIRFNAFDGPYEYRQIQLKAGYGNNLPVIFSGNITYAWSVREGTNFITHIECFDGGFAFANSKADGLSFVAGTPQKTVITTMVDSLSQYNVARGVIGDYPGNISRGNTYSGSTTDILSRITGGGFFIDNGKANCLGNGECLTGGVAVVDTSSGLLNTPVLEETQLTFDMIFEPGAIAGQLIQLTSVTESNFNGPYKLNSVKHRGMISESVCGEAITSLGMFRNPNGSLTGLPV